jgi:hypothetical protein
MVALGAAMLLNRELFPAMVGQIAQDYGLIFLSGVLSLIGGIAIVRVHNVWSGGWRVIITLIGWLAVIGGLVRMWFPQKLAPIAASFANNGTALVTAGAIVFALGAFLSFKAYGPDM